MKVPQPRHGRGSGPYERRVRWYGQIATGYGICRRGEIFPRQRHGRPVTRGEGLTVERRTTRAVEDDVAGRHVHPAVAHCGLVRFGKKADRGSLRRQRANEDPRKIFVPSLQPEPGQVDLGQFSAVVTSYGDENFRLRTAEGRLV